MANNVRGKNLGSVVASKIYKMRLLFLEKRVSTAGTFRPPGNFRRNYYTINTALRLFSITTSHYCIMLYQHNKHTTQLQMMAPLAGCAVALSAELFVRYRLKVLNQNLLGNMLFSSSEKMLSCLLLPLVTTWRYYCTWYDMLNAYWMKWKRQSRTCLCSLARQMWAPILQYMQSNVVWLDFNSY